MSYPTIYTNAQDVSNEDIKKAADATCNCLEKEKISENISALEAQAVFGKCLMSEAAEIMMKMASQEDMLTAATELGEKLMLQMITDKCEPVTKIITAMSSGSQSENPFLQFSDKADVETKDAAGEKDEFKKAEGTVLLVEEKEFLTITIKTVAGRELKFLYYNYVNGSDEWVRNAATRLKNKKVSINYIETEVYQAAIKEFTQIKIIKELVIE